MHSSILSQDIRREYDWLIHLVTPLPVPLRILKAIDGTGGKVSVADLIAYQIGWGQSVIRWYEAGIRDEAPLMPGDGFTTWDYRAIAEHFYQKYRYDCGEEQLGVFRQTVLRLLEITETEHRVDQIGVWGWCTLPSGKQWPLSKWIRVNTAAPYKRAAQLIKKAKL